MKIQVASEEEFTMQILVAQVKWKIHRKKTLVG